MATPKPDKTASAARSTLLDAVRGVAIVLIVFYHYYGIPKDSPHLFRIGWIGVDLFFVLSGFLIGGMLMTYGATPGFFKIFWIRRFFRIFPAYLILLGILSAFAFFEVRPSWTYFALLQNFEMTAATKFGRMVLSPTWSLAVEWQFYIFFPILLARLPEKRVPIVCAAVFLAAILFREAVFYLEFANRLGAYVLMPARMDSFAAGVLAAWLARRLPSWTAIRRERKFLFAAIFLCAAAGAVWILRIEPRHLGPRVMVHFGYSILALFFAGGVLAAFWLGDKFSKHPAASILAYLGRISFGIYLFHQPVKWAVGHALRNKDTALLSIAVVIAFASLLFWTVERPLIGWAKRYRFAGEPGGENSRA